MQEINETQIKVIVNGTEYKKCESLTEPQQFRVTEAGMVEINPMPVKGDRVWVVYL